MDVLTGKAPGNGGSNTPCHTFRSEGRWSLQASVTVTQPPNPLQLCPARLRVLISFTCFHRFTIYHSNIPSQPPRLLRLPQSPAHASTSILRCFPHLFPLLFFIFATTSPTRHLFNSNQNQYSIDSIQQLPLHITARSPNQLPAITPTTSLRTPQDVSRRSRKIKRMRQE